MRDNVKRKLALLLVLPILGLVAAVTPSAANFGSIWDPPAGPPNGAGDSPSMANNKWHAINKPSGLMWQISSAISHGAWAVDQTDMSGYIDNGDPNPDVYTWQEWIQQPPFGVVRGLSRCPSGALWGSGGTNLMWCRGQEIVFYTSAPSWTTTYKWAGCHELGHTIGLRHTGSTSSCMTTNETSHGESFSYHDKTSHVNPYY